MPRRYELSGEAVPWRPGRLVRQILKEQRNIVRKLCGFCRKPVVQVHLTQVNKSLSTVPALTMHVFKQVQRMGSCAIKQEHVALLYFVEIQSSQIIAQIADHLLAF